MEVKKKCLPLQSQTKNGVHKHSKFGKASSLKRLFTVQEASTEKYNLSRSVNSFERIISVRDKLRIIRNYTMKSLILAQD
ncbi:MAG: hypothetical protein J6A91_06160, partial [Bacteroidales bacterium]|nr:hypothetical protein [Bacteroidales bacterium]